MAEDTRYTANTGMVTISTANTALDGTGTLGTVLTGAANGTLIKSVIIKAITSTTKGMVRLFIYNGSSTQLVQEVEVPAITKSGINMAFETRVELNFSLQSGDVLKAGTQNAESFNIIAEGVNWAYNTVALDTTQYTTNFGYAPISTANSGLDGSGTLGLAYTAGSSTTYKGSSIKTITIKGTGNNTPGMVRLFFTDNVGGTYLFSENVVPGTAQDAVDQAFEKTIEFENDFDLQSDYLLYAATQNAELFNVLVDGEDWNYAT